MIRCISILANPDRKEAVINAEAAGRWLSTHGVQCDLIRHEDNCDKSDPDLVLTFGGDGTLLRGARFAVRHQIPLMGFNNGTVGFLTEEEPEFLESALEKIVNEQFRIEERMLLSVRTAGTGEQFVALNDAVITRGGFARLIRVECKINGELLDTFTADGILAATPTGSTGYSLSAGGPILDPGMKGIIITPVCVHSLRHCPCIVSAESEISFRLRTDRIQSAELQIDGINRGMLEAGDEISVSGSSQKLSLVRLHPYRFYHVLRTKLQEWGTDSEKEAGK